MAGRNQDNFLSTERLPLVTFALFAYNQEKYIRQAVESAFAQTYQPLEIILSDDCSTDQTYKIIEELAEGYVGPHRIIVNRNTANLGIVQHINHVMTIVRGDLVIAAAGDDVSFETRTTETVKYWISNNKVSGSLFSYYIKMDAHGNKIPSDYPNKMEVFFLRDRQLRGVHNFNGASGCTQAWSKDLFEIFGPLDGAIYNEDTVLPIRALLAGSITFIPLQLVYYRLTEGSLSRIKYNDARERISKQLCYWKARDISFTQMDKDLATSRSIGLANPDDLDWLSLEIEKGRLYAKTQCKLLSGSSITRFFNALDPALKLSLRERIKWIMIALAPWIYGLRFPL